MKRKRERVRLAKKEGWYRGHSKQNPLVLYDPEYDLDLCIAYEEGWGEGINAPDDATNPYGIHEDNYVPTTGWYKASETKAHFFVKGMTRASCGMLNFNGRFEPVSHPPERMMCKACRK